MAHGQQGCARIRRLIRSSDSPGRPTPLSFLFFPGAEWPPRLVAVVTEGGQGSEGCVPAGLPQLL